MRPFLEKTKNFPIIISPPRYLNNGTVARLMTHSGPLWRVGDSAAAAESSSLSPHVVTHLKMIRHTRTQGLPPPLLLRWLRGTNLKPKTDANGLCSPGACYFNSQLVKKGKEEKKGEQNNQTQKTQATREREKRVGIGQKTLRKWLRITKGEMKCHNIRARLDINIQVDAVEED